VMLLDWFMANPPSWAVKEPVDPLQAIVRHCAGVGLLISSVEKRALCESTKATTCLA
jgi:hypothetical protein